MTDSMIDRVAAMIAQGVADDAPSEAIARAVLKEVREPTETMLQAASKAYTNRPLNEIRSLGGALKDCHLAMIDAALKD